MPIDPDRPPDAILSVAPDALGLVFGISTGWVPGIMAQNDDGEMVDVLGKTGENFEPFILWLKAQKPSGEEVEYSFLFDPDALEALLLSISQTLNMKE